MSPWLKKLVLAAALLVMPLQGIAATLSVLLCHGDTQIQATHVNGEIQHGTHQDEGGTVGHHAYHPCCHFSASVPPVEALPAATFDFPVRTFAPDSLHDLFVPDRPQRPPLA